MKNSPVSKSSFVAKSPLRKTTLSKSCSLPRSPMPYSPMPKSPVIYEKYKSRCAYGLISMFNFRRKHSKKLISDSDRRRFSRHSLGAGDKYIKDKIDIHSDQLILDEINGTAVETESGNVMATKKNATAKVEKLQSSSEMVNEESRNLRKVSKTARKARHLPIYGCYDVSTVGNEDPSRQNTTDRSSKSDAVTAEVLPRRVCSKVEGDRKCKKSTNIEQCDRPNEINVQVSMSEATEAFINQKLIDGKHRDGVANQSKQFLDALEILNSNKDLFIKLLQDPNSLLAKHIEDLRDTQAKQQQAKFLIKSGAEREKADAKESNLSKSYDTSDSESLEDIVVLRPNRLRNVQQSVKPAFFPFEQMKRKFMQTMGIRRKEKKFMLTDGAHFEGSSKKTGMEIFPRNTFAKASSDFEGMVASPVSSERKDHMDYKVSEFDPGIREDGASTSGSSHENSSSTSRHPESNRQDENAATSTSNSELRNGNATLLRKKRAKTWDGISSIHEDSFRGTSERGSISPKTNFSAYSNLQTGSDSNWRSQREKRRNFSSPPGQSLEDPLWTGNRKQLQMYERTSDNNLSDVQTYRTNDSSNNDSSQTETKYNKNSEEISSLEVISKADGSEAIDTCEEDESSAFSRVDSPEESQTSTSSSDEYLSSPSNNQNFGEFERFKNNSEQPSPVSVLDHFFTDNTSISSDAEFRPAQPSVRQLQIGSEEGWLANSQPPMHLKLCSSTSNEEYRSMFEYVSTILEVCELNWDELAWRCHFSDEVLDRTSLEDINVQPKSCRDQRLLFDYINETLVDVCGNHSGCSAWLSFIKQQRNISNMATGSLLDEVMKNVDWNLLATPPLRTIEKILDKDLHISRTWMDIRTDAGDVVSEMVDNLVEELAAEIALE